MLCVPRRLALTAMSKYPEAISFFKKALVLDPENDTYKSNLKIAEQKQREASGPVSTNKPVIIHHKPLMCAKVSLRRTWPRLIE